MKDGVSRRDLSIWELFIFESFWFCCMFAISDRAVGFRRKRQKKNVSSIPGFVDMIVTVYETVLLLMHDKRCSGDVTGCPGIDRWTKCSQALITVYAQELDLGVGGPVPLFSLLCRLKFFQIKGKIRTDP